MTCDEVRPLFSDVADARLAPAERAAWDAHLATCTECRREWASFQRTLGLLHELPRHRAPVGFIDRVMAAAHPVPWPRRLTRRLFVPLRVKLPLEATALVLVAVGAVYLAQRTPEMQEAMRDAVPGPTYVAPAPATPEPTAPAPQPEPAAFQPDRPDRQGEPAAPPPATPKTDVGALTKPESKASADLQRAAPETAPEKSAERVQAQPHLASPDSGEVAPAPEARAPSRDVDTGRLMRQERVRTTTAVQPRVTGRLAVEDRDAAERALAALIARVGATEVGRRPAADGLLVEVDVPHAQYAAFTRGLASIGGWTPREERLSPGTHVRARVVVVRAPAH
jgi:hypothetical protein